MKGLTHIDSKGCARMVDISGKKSTLRKARASAFVRMEPETQEKIQQGNLPKGDVLTTARIAAILAAKRVDELIPLAHSLPLDHVEVDFFFEEGGIKIATAAAVRARTGVEMEALVAAAVAALTIYDMAKSIDRHMTIDDIRLEYKSGGRSGTWTREKQW